MTNPVVWFEILSGPGGASALRDFYSSTFGWQYDVVEDYAMLQRGDDDPGIGGGLGEDAEGATAYIMIAVDDVAAYLERVKANGGEVALERTVVPGMATYARVRDPAGNTIGLVEAETPPAD